MNPSHVPPPQAAVDEPTFQEAELRLSGVPLSTCAFLTGTTSVAEGLRTTAMRLRFDRRGPSARTFAVASAGEGEGKTSVALGLATAFAQAGDRVLVIDADLRRRSATVALGQRPSPGLAEWLEAITTVLPLRKVQPVGFDFLSAGEADCRPELLGSPRMHALLTATERRFQVVVIDSAPLLPVADTLALRGHVGGYLIVARSRRTKRDALARAISLVGEERVLGVVLNGYVSHLADSSPYQYGYKYGNRYGSTAGPRGSR